MAFSLTANERARLDERGVTVSLSQRERAGVRENAMLAPTLTSPSSSRFNFIAWF